MRIHDRAWAGFRIIVVGGQPMMAMRIEQAFAAAVPGVEVQLSSFESYEEAYNYCKKNRNIGFFLLAERCKDLSFQQIFRELSTHSQSDSIPTFSAVFYENTANPFCERVIGKTTEFLDYFSAHEFVSDGKASFIVGQLWEKFVNSYENSVIPKALQSSLRSVAEDAMGLESIHFTDRLLANLCSELNVTWQELVALKWAKVLNVVNATTPAILKPHNKLLHLIYMCGAPGLKNKDTIESLIRSEIMLPKKVFALVEHLESHRKSGTLSSELDRLACEGRPGAPKLFRHIAKHNSRIISFASQAEILKASFA